MVDNTDGTHHCRCGACNRDQGGHTNTGRHPGGHSLGTLRVCSVLCVRTARMDLEIDEMQRAAMAILRVVCSRRYTGVVPKS